MANKGEKFWEQCKKLNPKKWHGFLYVDCDAAYNCEQEIQNNLKTKFHQYSWDDTSEIVLAEDHSGKIEFWSLVSD